MNLKYIENKQLPPLAWCAVISKKSETVEVTAGCMVECMENGFVSGVWDGDFQKLDLENTLYLCCSGGYIYERGGVKFTTPTHPQESIFAIKVCDRLFVSNSLPFVLTMANERLDANYYNYEYDLCSSILGYEKFVKRSPLYSGNKLQIFRCARVSVDRNLNTSEEEQRPIFPMDDFKQYKASVLGVLRRIVENGQSPTRKHQYGLISTISRGYDASATSALVKEVGCNTTLSLIAPVKYLSDDGRDIARIMGYENILTGDGEAFKKCEHFEEAMYLCSGTSGMTFYCFEKNTAGNILFEGERGDSMWERLNPNVNDRLDFSWGNGIAQSAVGGEQYLHNNTIKIDVPLIGCQQWTDVQRISHSEEMKPWVVREHYDRPIARRLVEEKGVGREDFGRAKMGAGIALRFETLKSLSRKMSPKSHADLLSWYNRLKRDRLREVMAYLKYYKSEFPMYANYAFSKIHLKFRIRSKSVGWYSSPTQQLLILWANEKMIDKYKKYLQ